MSGRVAEPRVTAERLSVAYGSSEPAIHDVSFSALPGQVVALLGPNGGGKTTLFRALLGELPAIGGTVAVHGRLGYVPQTERSRLDFPVNAFDVVLMGTYARTPWYRRVGSSERRAAADALARVGLADQARAGYGTLSGGQRQRVLIARALAQDAETLLLDEPLTGVDQASAERVLDVLESLRADGRTVLVATHDMIQARRFDAVVCINRTQIAFGPPDEILTEPVLAATYGAELVMLGSGEQAVTVQHHSH